MIEFWKTKRMKLDENIDYGSFVVKPVETRLRNYSLDISYVVFYLSSLTRKLQITYIQKWWVFFTRILNAFHGVWREDVTQLFEYLKLAIEIISWRRENLEDRYYRTAKPSDLPGDIIVKWCLRRTKL